MLTTQKLLKANLLNINKIHISANDSLFKSWSLDLDTYKQIFSNPLTKYLLLHKTRYIRIKNF